MKEDHRIDAQHGRNGRPNEVILRAVSLDRGQTIQTLALDFRNQVAFKLKGKTPEDVADTLVPHGDPTHHPEIIETALMLEFAKPGADRTGGSVVHTLELIREKLGIGSVSAPPLSTMQSRLEAGEAIRSDNSDLQEQDWEALLQTASPELRSVIDTLRGNSLAMRHTLDRHDKFDVMQNAKAFERDVNAAHKPGAFVFFDLINFKNYNSRYSYDFVDTVILDRLCKALRDNLPKEAFVSIKGGDEFMVFIPDDAPDAPANSRAAATLVADIVQRAMETVTAEDVDKARSFLIGKKKPALTVVSKFVAGIIGKNSDDGEQEVRRETEQILRDVRGVHGKVSAVKKSAEMSCAAATHATEAGLKKVSSWHERANMRFPSSVVEADGKLSPPFSATGSETRDFFVGVRNDLRDLIGRLTR